jgi:hypothetical protein
MAEHNKRSDCSFDNTILEIPLLEQHRKSVDKLQAAPPLEAWGVFEKRFLESVTSSHSALLML